MSGSTRVIQWNRFKQWTMSIAVLGLRSALVAKGFRHFAQSTLICMNEGFGSRPTITIFFQTAAYALSTEERSGVVERNP